MPAIFVLVDALGWQLIEDRDFLADILPHRQELQTIFGFSSAAIPSILTGMVPREHGHWNLFVYDPENSPFWFAKPLRYFPNWIANSRIVRKATSFLGRRLSKTRGYFQIYGVPTQILPLFDVCEKEDIYAPGGLEPVLSIFDLLKREGVPYRSYSYHELNDHDIVKKSCNDIASKKADFYFIYLCELDEFLHYNIADGRSVENKLKYYEEAIAKIYATALKADSNCPFYVFSDHGMTRVHETYDLMGEVGALGYSVPDDYLALFDSTMARFWFFNDGARREISERLANLPCGHWVSEQDRRAFGIDFDHQRFGQSIFMMNEGVLMHPSHMGRVPWQGMHGFHPNAPSSSASLLARQSPEQELRSVVDLFPLMVKAAGLRK